MKAFALVIFGTALALAVNVPTANAFNPQPDPPKVKAKAGQPDASKAKMKLGVPPDDGKAKTKAKFDTGQSSKGIVVIGTQPGTGAPAKSGVSQKQPGAR